MHREHRGESFVDNRMPTGLRERHQRHAGMVIARLSDEGRAMITHHVSEYMTSGPFAVGPREPLRNARRLMAKYELRHLPVWSEGNLIGIVSDRDLNLVQSLAHAPPESITVEDAMTADPYAPSPDTPLSEVVRVMIDRKIGSAVVVDNGQVVGIFTATDAMRALLDLIGQGARRDALSKSATTRRRPTARF